MEPELNCAEFEIQLADWIDGTLAHPAAFLRHRQSCQACALLAEDARFAADFIESAPRIEYPATLVAKILSATNPSREVRLHGSGFSGWINRTFAPILQPRLVMSAVMTLMSFALLAQSFGLPEDPARLWSSLDRDTHRMLVSALKTYDTMPLVYEVRSRIEDWNNQ